jgi:regulator of sigma E protease
MFILNLILFVIVLGVIIVLHEFGHYYFAKKAGIRIHEFSLGMGPSLYGKRADGDVLFSIRAIPIGGYVSMAGEAITDALIKKGDKVSFIIEKQEVVSIILDATDGKEVIDFDLYGKDQQPLFIKVAHFDQEETYAVSRDAKYIIKKNQYMYVTPEEYSFESKSLKERFLVIFGGPMMNFILAFVLYFVVGLFMMTPNLQSTEVKNVIETYPASNFLNPGDSIQSINGISVETWTEMSQVLSNLTSQTIDVTYESNNNIMTYEDLNVVVSIQTFGITNLGSDGSFTQNIGQVFGRAKESGLSEFDMITNLTQNNISQDITSFDDFITFFRQVTSGDVSVTYLKNGSDVRSLNVTLLSEETLSKLGYASFSFQLGITPTETYQISQNLLHPFKAIGQNVTQVFQTLGLLFSANDDIGLSDLSGPIGIFSLVSQTSTQGILAILSFTAFLSVNIGLLNLLPIPALDGGRLVFLAFEGITKKPLSKKLENSINMFMFYALMLMFVYVSYHDILRIIRGLF